MVLPQLIIPTRHSLIGIDVTVGSLLRWMAIVRTEGRVTHRNKFEGILRYGIEKIWANFVLDAKTGDVWPQCCGCVPEITYAFKSGRCDR